MSTAPHRYLTPEDYLEFERKSEERHEYFNGEIFLMSGASRHHSLIAGNIFAAVHAIVRSKNCEAHMVDMRVKVSPTGLYTYPDLVITCASPEFEDNQVDTLLNPQAIIEVLSPSTESYDRGTKFRHYRSIPSLREYLLVSQDSPHVDRFSLDGGGHWVLSDADGLEAEIEIAALGTSIPLADVYATVDFSRQASTDNSCP